MDVAQLGRFFAVTQYQLLNRSAWVELVDGEIEVHARYGFYNEDGRETCMSVRLRMVVTPQQSNELKAILVNILQATNAAIETETGWTKRGS